MNINDALKILDEHIKSSEMKKHCIFSAYIMEELAKTLNQDPVLWFLTGLFHDIDNEKEGSNPQTHGLLAEAILEKSGFTDENAIEAIKFHNAENNGIGERSKLLHHALSACETVSGLISAMALILPDKRVEKVKVKSLLKRMKEKAFARNVSRESIQECEKFDMPLDKFMEISLNGAKRAEAEHY